MSRERKKRTKMILVKSVPIKQKLFCNCSKNQLLLLLLFQLSDRNGKLYNRHAPTKPEKINFCFPKKQFISISIASFSAAKKFRQLKNFGVVSFNHRQPLNYGKCPLGQNIRNKKASSL